MVSLMDAVGLLKKEYICVGQRAMPQARTMGEFPGDYTHRCPEKLFGNSRTLAVALGKSRLVPVPGELRGGCWEQEPSTSRV